MNILENINELGKKINFNEINFKEIQEKFLESTIGKIANSAIDIGLKKILPDFIEDEVIEVKDSLISGGLKEGINTAIKNSVEIGKELLGISDENFEKIEQAKDALQKGNVVQAISSGIDLVIDNLKDTNNISSNVGNAIKSGKDIILNNIDDNIKNEFLKENSLFEKIKNHINKWEENYNNKDLEGLNNEYEKIEKIAKEIMPIESVIKNINKIENIHKLIENTQNISDFNFDNTYLDLAKIF